jgi:AbiV family abortive infection protein
MKGLTIEELHELRLRIFDNAEQLYKESTLLFEHKHYARACLLAHFCCEELGKIPIVVGVIGKLMNKSDVDWKRVIKRFRDHKLKIDSNDFHHYMYAIEADLLRDTDLEWLKQANEDAPKRVEQKNLATYVDVRERNILSPLDNITEQDAIRGRERAFESLKAHWLSEQLTNPIIAAAAKEAGRSP